MKRSLCLSLILALPCLGAAASPPPGGAASVHKNAVAPLLATYCTDCHGPEKQKGKVNLAGDRTAGELAGEGDLWFRVLDQLEAGKMPPRAEEQPAPAERATLTGWVRGELTQLLLARQREEGRAKLRRLTRTEYANTLEDLFGVRPLVEDELPPDGLADGYDKASGALALSSEGVRGYLKLAADALQGVLRPKPAGQNRTIQAPAAESAESKGQSLGLKDGAVASFNTDSSSGGLQMEMLQTSGVYRLRLSVYGYQTGQPLPFGIYAGNTTGYPQQLELLEVLAAPPGRPTMLETSVYLKRDARLRLIPYGLGVPVPKNAQASGCRAPALAVRWVELTAPELPPRGDRLLTADFPPALVTELRGDKAVSFAKRSSRFHSPKSTTREEFRAIMRKTFARVGARLFRRDLTVGELDGFTAEAMRHAEDMSLETAFFSQIIEMLTAPDFLCVIEQPGRLSDFALASRLAYFLWDSAPDEALLDLAREGRLRDAQVLAEQTDRLLGDPKSARFIADFTDQWLGLRGIAETSPDSTLYPGYDELVRFSSVRETRAFLRTLIAENRSVRELVAARWTWVNQPLAGLYGLPPVPGVALRRVELPGFSPYGGVWTQSAVLKVTANGTNTSPVKRGVFVAERLLGLHIPPPPPGTEPIQPDIRGAETFREQLALHSRSAACATCHARFDPYGFALESFDVVGHFRLHYRVPNPLPAAQRNGEPGWRAGLPVDSSGQTVEGQPFADLAGLRQLLAAHPRQLALGLTRHLVTYATGTPPGPVDAGALDAIVDHAAAGDYPVRSLLHALVQSELFRSK